MKSTPTPATHTGYTSEEITTTFGPTGGFKYEVTIPAGTKCRKLDGGHDPWVVADLSFMGHSNSFMRSDADIYGIRVKENNLANIRPITDRTPVDATYYAVISAKHDGHMGPDEEAKLRRAGIELSDYDNQDKVFYARLSPEARLMAKELASDFTIAVYPRFTPEADWCGNPADMPASELKAELAFHQFWMHSDSNDGRLTAGSSAELDLRSDFIEEIETRLQELATANQVKAPAAEAHQPSASTAVDAPGL